MSLNHECFTLEELHNRIVKAHHQQTFVTEFLFLYISDGTKKKRKKKLKLMTSNFSSVSNIYTLPFRSNVWISCLILFVVSSTLLFLTSKAEESQDIKADNEGELNGLKMNQQIRFSDSMMSTIAVSYIRKKTIYNFVQYKYLSFARRSAKWIRLPSQM